MKHVLFTITAMFFLYHSFAQKKVTINAEPGGEYLVESGRDIQITVIGSGTVSKPFRILGRENKNHLQGNSFIQVLGSNILIENIEFSDNLIGYVQSRGLISIGTYKKVVDNVSLKNIKFIGKDRFKTFDGKTQFHFIYINGNGVNVTDCVFTNKINRLPIIHVDAGLKNVLISNCEFKDVKEPKFDLAIEAIRVGLGSGETDLNINRNRFVNYYGDSELISVKCDRVRITNNYFLNTRSGVSIRYGNHCLISENYYENVYTPVRISGQYIEISKNTFKNKNNRSIFLMYGGANYLQVKNVDIIGNTFLDYFNIYGIQPQGHNLNPMNIVMKKNVILKGKDKQYVKDEKLSFNNLRSRTLVRTSTNNQIKEFILR